ncbi:hypothetical protein ANCCAN_11216 [Ancylostoma caninum]|uniref:Uncharacterized protein n=1 Tax=Ancylostoma caninum TaxID=29170 RepID=A0A368GGN7_ANCCA|nr:hypothetical protein ANCCAN_11216 [Ancylostoma caninum]
MSMYGSFNSFIDGVDIDDDRDISYEEQPIYEDISNSVRSGECVTHNDVVANVQESSETRDMSTTRSSDAPLFTRKRPIPTRQMPPENVSNDLRERWNAVCANSSLMDASYGESLVNLNKRLHFTNATLKALYKRKKLPPLDTVGLIKLADKCDEQPLLQELVKRIIPVSLKVDVVYEEQERLNAVVTSLQKQLNEEARNRVRIYASKFGSMKFPAPPGSWLIRASIYGPGDERANAQIDRAYDEENRHFVTARVREQQNVLIRLDHQIIIDFIVETCRFAGDALFNDGDLAAKRDVEDGILKSIQFTLWGKQSSSIQKKCISTRFVGTAYQLRKTESLWLFVTVFHIIMSMLLFSSWSLEIYEMFLCVAFTANSVFYHHFYLRKMSALDVSRRVKSRYGLREKAAKRSRLVSDSSDSEHEVVGTVPNAVSVISEWGEPNPSQESSLDNSMEIEESCENGVSEQRQPSTSVNEELDAAPLRSLDDDQLAVFAVKIYDRTSVAQLQRDFRFSALNSTSGIRIQFEKFQAMVNATMNYHGWQETVLCAACGERIVHKNALCYTPQCRLYLKNPGISVVNKRVTVTSCDAAVQIRQIVERHAKVIVDKHQELHQHRNTRKRRDCRDFHRFRSKLESTNSFRNGMMTIQLLLSMDGFSYQENQKGSTWLTSAKIIDLPPGLRILRENTVLISTVSAGRHPNECEFRTANSEFHEFLKRSRLNPLVISVGDKQYRVAVKASIAIMACYRIKGAGGNFGCCRCYEKGEYFERRHIWPHMENYTRRTPQSLKEDISSMKNGIYGTFYVTKSEIHFLAGTSIYSEICSAANVAVDYLHNVQEGIVKKIMQETLCEPVRRAGDGVSSWPMTVSKENRDELSQALRTTVWSGNARAFPRTPDDIKRMTGSQLMELFEFVVPLMLFENLSSSRKAAAVVMAFLFVLKSETAEELDKKACLKLGSILRLLSRIFDEVFGKKYASIKKHWSLDHHAEDILHVGTPQELSSSSFEKDYRLYKNAVSSGNTRAVETSSWIQSAISLAGFRYGTVYGQRGTTTQNYVISFFHRGRISVGEVVFFGITDTEVLMAVHKLDAVSPFREIKTWLRSNEESELLNTYRYMESKNRFWFSVKPLSEIIVTSANNIRGPGFTIQFRSSANTYFFCKKHKFQPE